MLLFLKHAANTPENIFTVTRHTIEMIETIPKSKIMQQVQAKVFHLTTLQSSTHLLSEMEKNAVVHKQQRDDAYRARVGNPPAGWWLWTCPNPPSTSHPAHLRTNKTPSEVKTTPQTRNGPKPGRAGADKTRESARGRLPLMMFFTAWYRDRSIRRSTVPCRSPLLSPAAPAIVLPNLQPNPRPRVPALAARGGCDVEWGLAREPDEGANQSGRESGMCEIFRAAGVPCRAGDGRGRGDLKSSRGRGLPCALRRPAPIVTDFSTTIKT